MTEGKPSKQFTWQHLAGLVITAGLLWFVFRKIPFSSFWGTLKDTRPFWFVIAFSTYGLALWFGACRWHMALHLTHRALHLLASYRLFLVGHFLYCVLFGAVGGDFAKSAVYARWFRFGLPEVVAAAPLDRVLGFGGTILYGVTAFLITYYNGGFSVLRQWQHRLPSGWIFVAGGLISALILSVIFWRPKGGSSLARAVRAFRSGSSRMVVTPSFIIPGTIFGILGQVGLTSVMALNLQAVTHHHLPWGQMVWTFPAIMLASAMPFTVAGAGAREMAALAFLGLYGVPAEECLAASLLTLCHKLVWALVGGLIFWRNGAFYRRTKDQPLLQSVSVVLATLNDERAIAETIVMAKANPEVKEVIVADGGSGDRTRQIAAELGCAVITTPARRGAQWRAGAQQATGDVVLLLQVNTLLSPYAGLAAINCLRDSYVVGGGFWKKYEHAPRLLFGARILCALRLIFFRRVAGDQAPFMRRSALEAVGGVPDVPMMEDFELCRRLRQKGHLALGDALVVTSLRQFEEQSYSRTYWRALVQRWKWRLGRSAREARETT
jgi:uncharacterized membrane protein YbhN (UPF0104 family)